MLHKGVVFAGDLPAELDGAGGGLLALEVVAVVQLHLVNALEAPHEVQMPVAAAEFAVRDGVEPGALLLLDQQLDLRIFNFGQGGPVDLAGLELGAGVFQGLRAQKAAHKIITERGTKVCHGNFLLFGQRSKKLRSSEWFAFVWNDTSIKEKPRTVKYEKTRRCHRKNLWQRPVRLFLVKKCSCVKQLQKKKLKVYLSSSSLLMIF